MTIASCFLTAEGVVLGADSTITMPTPGGEPRYYNHAQKLFQVGDSGTLGILMWGDIPTALSYRTLIADFAEEIRTNAPGSVDDAAAIWSARIHGELRRAFAEPVRLADEARTKGNGELTEDEQEALDFVDSFSTGFCIAGTCLPNRHPAAFEVDLQLGSPNPPTPERLEAGNLYFWGAPNVFRRVLHGIDYRIIDDILNAKRDDGTKLWAGTSKELYRLVFSKQLIVHPGIPIREAVDLVHFSILTTIKALKFSHFSPTCGGPIEIAVLTSDRPFRWVRHKSFDAAI